MIVAQTLEEAYQAVDDMMLNNAFGEAGAHRSALCNDTRCEASCVLWRACRLSCAAAPPVDRQHTHSLPCPTLACCPARCFPRRHGGG